MLYVNEAIRNHHSYIVIVKKHIGRLISQSSIVHINKQKYLNSHNYRSIYCIKGKTTIGHLFTRILTDSLLNFSIKSTAVLEGWNLYVARIWHQNFPKFWTPSNKLSTSSWLYGIRCLLFLVDFEVCKIELLFPIVSGAETLMEYVIDLSFQKNIMFTFHCQFFSLWWLNVLCKLNGMVI